jgi:hypothetical protein
MRVNSHLTLTLTALTSCRSSAHCPPYVQQDLRIALFQVCWPISWWLLIEEGGRQKSGTFLHEGEQHHHLLPLTLRRDYLELLIHHVDREQLEALHAQISIGLA